MTKRTGIIRTPNNTPNNIPPIAEDAIDLLPSAEAPPAKSKGISPAIKAKEVISIGRNLVFAPAMAELTIEFPSLRF